MSRIHPMITSFRDRSRQSNLLTAGIPLAVLALAFLLGQRASALWLGLLVAALGALVLLIRPALGLLALVAAALLVPLEISTGTEVYLNLGALLVPALLLLWVLDMIRRQALRLVPSPTTRPLALFLLAGLFSLFLGRATWDPSVPVRSSFLLVQLAQWAIFAFSAGAFWLTANIAKRLAHLQWLVVTFLVLGGGLAVLRLLPGVGSLANAMTTIAFVRAPFWILLAGLAGGQLLFNQQLTAIQRGGLLLSLGAVLFYAFVAQQEAASNWVGIAAVAGILVWLRWPGWRIPIVLLLLVLALLGFLLPTIYNFAGGDAEWFASGGSRLALTGRVVEMTVQHNPVTGLGPAAYRPYGFTQPLVYAHIIWAHPLISSHNNYVDIFAHTGLVGLFLFGWLAIEIGRLGLRLRARFTEGFAAGYLNGMLAVGVGSLVIMLLADWILPFVYNIGFPGFQASVLVWLFLGGLVALENLAAPEEH